MTDFYAKLGVPREATRDEIKVAFRAKARQTHPDARGNVEDFRDIADAYAVLGDVDRRARYDQSGDTATVSEETKRTDALNIIQQMMEQTLNQVGDGPICNDVVAKMREAAADAVSKIAADIEAMQRAIVRFAEFADRFNTAGDTNVLRGMVDHRIAAIERRCSDAAVALERHKMAAEILQDYSFEVDPEPMAMPIYGGFQQTTGSWVR